jgi:hypothetical protein
MKSMSFSVFAGGQDVGAVFFQLLNVGGGAEHEHAAVPVIVTRIDVFLGFGLVGLFNKPFHPVSISTWHHVPALYVAVARFGLFGHDTEGDQKTFFSHFLGFFHLLLEHRLFQNDVIGRQNQQNGILVVFDRMQRCQRDGRCGVFAHRLQNDVGTDLFCPQLFGDDEAVVFVANHHRGGGGQARAPIQCGLKHGFVCRQWQKLLGIHRSGQRPESGSRSACHHNYFHAFLL